MRTFHEFVEEVEPNFLSEMSRSKAAKEAHKGKDMFKKGKNFKKIEDKAAKEYGSEEAGKKVAGAIFWNKVKGK